MHKTKAILIIIMIFIASCKSGLKYKYAIKDFRKPLQPFLNTVVSIGYVTFHDSTIINSITDEELVLLSNSEHPILRATSLNEMLDRTTFTNYDVVMKHLNDTAIVVVDNGEFGMSMDMVSDFLIERAKWEALEEKNQTIDTVLFKHNYLSSAYKILSRFQPKEKYYPFIKDMATRPRRLDRYEHLELGFSDIEYALYGLAQYRKREDIEIISNMLMRHINELGFISFRLMKEFPDTAYMKVFESFTSIPFISFPEMDRVDSRECRLTNQTPKILLMH